MIRDEAIRDKVGVTFVKDKMREARLRLLRHVKRRAWEVNYSGCQERWR